MVQQPFVHVGHFHGPVAMILPLHSAANAQSIAEQHDVKRGVRSASGARSEVGGRGKDSRQVA